MAASRAFWAVLVGKSEYRPQALPSDASAGVVPLMPKQAPRYAVLRKHEGKTFAAYRGDDGGKALEAWERYETHPTLAGEFVFLDRLRGQRGAFTRTETVTPAKLGRA